MEIYDELKGQPLTEQAHVQIEEKEEQTELQGYLDNVTTPSDKADIATALTNSRTAIQKANFSYQKSLALSPLTIEKKASAIEDKWERLQIEVDENSNPLIPMSTQQTKSYMNLISNSSDPKKTMAKFENAQIFSTGLGISMEDAYKNEDQLLAQYAGGRFGNNPNVYEDIKTSFSIGRKGSDNSKLGIDRIKLEDSKVGATPEQLITINEQIEENLAEQEKNNTWINSHASLLDDNGLKEVLRSFGENIYPVAKTLAPVGAVGLGITAIGLALPIIAGTAVPLGASALFTTGSVAVFGAATQLMLSVKEMTKGSSYNTLREKGLSHENAKTTSDIIGSFTGAEEALLDGVGINLVKTIFGKKIGSAVVGTFLKKFALSDKTAKVLTIMGTAVLDAGDQALQEGTQELTDIIGTYMGESFEENGYANLLEATSQVTKDDLAKTYDSASMGFKLGFLTSSPLVIYQTHMGSKEFNKLEILAKTVESKEAFMKEAKEVTPETDPELLNDLYTRLKEKKSIKDKIEGVISPDLDEAGNKIQSPTGESNTATTKQSNIKVQLAPRSQKQTVAGNEVRVTRVYDKDNNQVGKAITILEDDTVRISKIDVTDPTLIKATVKELISKYPDKEIIWNTEDDSVLEDIKQELIDENPKGEEAGLNYYDSPENKDVEIAEQIREPFNLTEEQSIIGATLVKLHAEAVGKTAKEWWESTVKIIKPTKAKGVKGAVKFDPNAERIQAVIYTAKHADVSTFTHEVFHLSITQMENKNDLSSSIQNWAKTDEFINFFNENKAVFDTNFETTVKAIKGFDPNNKNWTRRQEEAVASIFEAWLIQGTTNNVELDSTMKKISEWVRAIYSSVKQTVKMDEAVSSYFDSMYAKQDIAEEIEPTSIETNTIEPEITEKKYVTDIRDLLDKTIDKIINDDTLTDEEKESRMDRIYATAEKNIREYEDGTYARNVEKNNSFLRELEANKPKKNEIHLSRKQKKKLQTAERKSKSSIKTLNQSDINKDEQYAKAVEENDTETIQELIDEEIVQAVERGIEILPTDEESVAFKYHRGEAPTKTKKVYAVFNVGNGLRPAFAGTENIMPIGTWLDAQAIKGIESSTKSFPDGTPKMYIPGTTGSNPKDVGINPTEQGLPKGQKFLFFRPGKHASDVPNFSQMNVKSEETGKNKSAMPHDKIVFEIEVGADVDLTEKMLEEAPKHKTTGKAMMREAGLQRIPKEGNKEGFYNYKTNPNAKGNWIIASSFKINRLVPYTEIVEKNNELGIEPPVWNGGYSPEEFGITDNLVETENAKIKKLSDPVAYNTYGELIPLSERFNDNSRTLFQLSKEAVRKEAVTYATNFNDVESFMKGYELENIDEVGKHETQWYEKVYEEAIKKISQENVKKLYDTADTGTKNRYFANSLKDYGFVDGFIRQMKAFRKVINKIDTKKDISIDNKIKMDFFKEMTNIIPEEILNVKTLSKESRKQISEITEKNPSAIRLIYAKLFGVEYMMEQGEFSDVDYFEEVEEISDEAKVSLTNSLVKSSDTSARDLMRYNYKKALADMQIHIDHIEEKKTLLEAQKKAVIAKLRANKLDTKEKLKEIKAEYKLKEKQIIKDANEKNTNLEYMQKNKGLREKINKEPASNVAIDYADKMDAIRSLFDGRVRSGFKGEYEAKWDVSIVNDIIRERMGDFIADIYNIDVLNGILEGATTNEDLEFFYQLRNEIRKDGIEQRRMEIAEQNAKIDFTRGLCEGSLNNSITELTDNKIKQFSDKIPATRVIFKTTMNIVRKAMVLDGLKKGPIYNLLVTRRRTLSDIEKAKVDTRMSKISSTMEKNKVSMVDISKTVLTTKVDGKDMKHSISDLFYYSYAQKNMDNKIAVSCGVLMSEAERQNSELSNNEFLNIAEKRYKEVLAEAENYIHDPKYAEIFEVAWNEFNNGSIDEINAIIKKTQNKRVNALNFYLPIMRKIFTEADIVTEFSNDIDGRQFNNNASTNFGSLQDREKINARQQQPMNTNMIYLIQDTIQKQEHLLAFYEYVNEVKGVFTGENSANLGNNIKANFGKQMYEDIETFIKEVANPYARKPETGTDELARLMVGKLYPALLSFKASTVVMQLVTSPAIFKQKMTYVQYLSSFNHTVAHKAEVVNKVNALSPFMKERAWDYAWSDIKKIIERMGGEKNALLLKHEYWMEKGMGGLQWADTLTVYSGWNQMYEMELEKLGTPTTEHQKLAARYADDFIRDTQPHSDLVEIAPIFKGTEATKAFTRFTASLSPIFQNTTFDAYMLGKEHKYKELFGSILGYGIAGALLFAVTGGYDSNDSEEEIMKKFLYSLLSQPASSVPFIGGMWDYTLESIMTGEKSGLYGTSLMPPIESLLTAVRSYADGDIGKGLWSTFKGIGLWNGLPVNAASDIASIPEDGWLQILGYDKD